MFTIVLSCSLCLNFAVAQPLTASAAFKEMPDTLLPYLTTNNRLDLIDFHDSQMKAEVTNALDGKSLLVALTADSLSLQLNEAVRLDMMILPIDGEPIDSCNNVIALIYSYGTGDVTHEQTLTYYTAKWRRLTVTPPLTAAAIRRIPVSRK